MKPTLLVLAAGMGSRYGGLKQLDGVGPHGETIMDYSIYDAIRGGFGKVVFVIRKDFQEEFQKVILSKYEGHIPVAVAFQQIDDLPEGFSVPEGRVKPWGTAHAILAARDVINEPFTVINADDFYGQDAFAVMGDYLSKPHAGYSMVGFKLGNTMSENGSVSRGVCTVSDDHKLIDIVERTAISYDADHNIEYKGEDGEMHRLSPDTLVSMNFWGLAPDYFQLAYAQFVDFLKLKGNELKSEFYIPSTIDKMIKEGIKQVDVLGTDSQWFGVTYPEDRPGVVERLATLHAAGVYPEKMF